MKPIMLLDVDGVLNVFGPGYQKNCIHLGNGHPFYPSSFTKKFMKYVWPAFEVWWCTAWRGMANQIARWAGLPNRPWIEDMRSKVFDDWKLRGAIRKFGRSTRPLIWIEDGLSDEALNWCARADHRWYMHTVADVGIRERHLLMLGAWKHVAESQKNRKTTSTSE